MRIPAFAIFVCAAAGLAQAGPGISSVTPVRPPPPRPDMTSRTDPMWAGIIAARDRCVSDEEASIECRYADQSVDLEQACTLRKFDCQQAANQQLAAAGLSPPAITSTIPAQVRAGTTLVLRGRNLRLNRWPLHVELYGDEGIEHTERTALVLATPTATELDVRIPLDAPSGGIRIATVWGPLIDRPIEVTYPAITPAPVWTTAQPASVGVDCPLVLSGTGFESGDQIAGLHVVATSFTGGTLTVTFSDNATGPQTVTATILRRKNGAISSAVVTSPPLTVTYQQFYQPIAAYPSVAPGGRVSIAMTIPVADPCGADVPLPWSMSVAGALAPGASGDLGQGTIAPYSPTVEAGRTGCWISSADRTHVDCAIPTTLPMVVAGDQTVPAGAVMIWFGQGHGGFYVNIQR